MFKLIYNSFKNLFFKSARYNQESCYVYKPMEEVLKNMVETKVKYEQKQYNLQYIRFICLSSGHNLGRLTSEEEREFNNMSVYDFRQPWKREMIGMRSCNIIL